MNNHPPYPISRKYVEKRKALFLFYPVDEIADDGRALLEGRSYLHKPTDLNYAKCPYSDDRRASCKPMNVGALKSFTRGRQLILDTIDSQILSMNYYLGASESSLETIWRFSYVGWSRPLFHKIKEPEEKLNGNHAHISRLCHGLLSLVHVLPIDLKTIWTADELYEAALKTKSLIGFREVCAAPPKLITQIIQLILEDRKARTKKHNSIGMIDDFGYIRFAVIRWNIERIGILYEAARCLYLLKFAATDLKQTYAFPYARGIKHQCSTKPVKYIENLPKILNNNSFGCTSDLGTEAFELFSKYMSEIYSTDSVAAASLAFSSAQNLAIELLNINERKLCALLGDDFPHSYSQHDLIIFFGPTDLNLSLNRL